MHRRRPAGAQPPMPALGHRHASGSICWQTYTRTPIFRPIETINQQRVTNCGWVGGGLSTSSSTDQQLTGSALAAGGAAFRSPHSRAELRPVSATSSYRHRRMRVAGPRQQRQPLAALQFIAAAATTAAALPLARCTMVQRRSLHVPRRAAFHQRQVSNRILPACSQRPHRRVLQHRLLTSVGTLARLRWLRWVRRSSSAAGRRRRRTRLGGSGSARHLQPSARLSFDGTPCTFIRCFNRDKQGVSSK